jgi:hypothetical protein
MGKDLARIHDIAVLGREERSHTGVIQVVARLLDRIQLDRAAVARAAVAGQRHLSSKSRPRAMDSWWRCCRSRATWRVGAGS